MKFLSAVLFKRHTFGRAVELVKTPRVECRDLDGSNTNGFFNHRQDHDSTRTAWMMCLGQGAKAAGVIGRPVQHIDVCPTIASLFGVSTPDVLGKSLAEIRA